MRFRLVSKINSLHLTHILILIYNNNKTTKKNEVPNTKLKNHLRGFEPMPSGVATRVLIRYTIEAVTISVK